MYVELIKKWREYHFRSMELFSINSEGEAAVRDFARWLDRQSAQQSVHPTDGGLCENCHEPLAAAALHEHCFPPATISG
jgi:hypothetical protein